MATVVEVDRQTVALLVDSLENYTYELLPQDPDHRPLATLIDELKSGRVRVVRGTDQAWRELGLTQSPPREPYRRHPTTSGG